MDTNGLNYGKVAPSESWNPRFSVHQDGLNDGMVVRGETWDPRSRAMLH